MSHFTVLVTGPDPKGALAPFEEGLQVEPWQKYTRESLIAEGREAIADYVQGTYVKFLADPEAYREKYRHARPEHFKYLEEFPRRLEWTDDEVYAYEVEIRGGEGEVREDGSFWTTANPQARWDWWKVGGRWSGGLIPKGAQEDEASGMNVATLDQVDLEKTHHTWAILHDGEWIQRGKMGLFGTSQDDYSEEAWDVRWREYLQALPGDTIVTLVDCHI